MVDVGLDLQFLACTDLEAMANEDQIKVSAEDLSNRVAANLPAVITGGQGLAFASQGLGNSGHADWHDESCPKSPKSSNSE
jgi:hypothetical protein